MTSLQEVAWISQKMAFNLHNREKSNTLLFTILMIMISFQHIHLTGRNVKAGADLRKSEFWGKLPKSEKHSFKPLLIWKTVISEIYLAKFT